MKTKTVPLCPWCGEHEENGDFCQLCVASTANPNNNVGDDNRPSQERYKESSHWDGQFIVANLDLVCRRANIAQAVLEPSDITPEQIKGMARAVDRAILARIHKKLQDEKDSRNDDGQV